MNKSDHSDVLNNQIKKGLFWSFLERGGTQIVNFVVQLVLARLLCPDDYGLLAILNVFITFSGTFVNNGLGNAVIQKKNSDETDMCTVFYVQLFIAILFVAVLFFIAPFVALYYENPDLSLCLRVMSVGLIIDALYAMQFVKLKISMQFNKLFIANACGIVAQSVVGISMASMDFGVWSLIISQLTQKTVIFIVTLISIHWFPKLKFSFSRLKQLFGFSWKLFVGWIIGTIHQDIYSLVVGKFYSTETLGYYNRGSNLPSTVTKMVTETVSNVMFPALSKIQSDAEGFKNATRKMMVMTAFIIWPVIAGIAAISENFVMVVLTDKWATSIPMMQIFAIAYGFNMISSTNMQAFNAIGRSDVFLKLEVIKRSVSIALLFVACLFFNIYVVIAVNALMGLFSVVFNGFMNKKLLNYSFKEQISDIMPPMLVSAVMFLAAICINFIPGSYLVKLVLQIVVGVSVYFIISFIFKVKGIYLLKDFLHLKSKKQ